MEQIVYGTSAPHRRSKITTEKIMQCIILALLPAGIHGVFRYGIQAVVVILLTCISAVVTEVVFEKVTKKHVSVRSPPHQSQLALFYQQLLLKLKRNN